MVSRTLDDPSVPPGVVDFIMYHELLHKKLGVKVIGKRRYGHTPEFRRAEKAFLQYAQAQAFLQAIAEKRLTARRVRTRPCLIFLSKFLPLFVYPAGLACLLLGLALILYRLPRLRTGLIAVLRSWSWLSVEIAGWR